LDINSGFTFFLHRHQVYGGPSTPQKKALQNGETFQSTRPYFYPIFKISLVTLNPTMKKYIKQKNTQEHKKI